MMANDRSEESRENAPAQDRKGREFPGRSLYESFEGMNFEQRRQSYKPQVVKERKASTNIERKAPTETD